MELKPVPDLSSCGESQEAWGVCSQSLSVWALPCSSRSPTPRFHLNARSSRMFQPFAIPTAQSMMPPEFAQSCAMFSSWTRVSLLGPRSQVSLCSASSSPWRMGLDGSTSRGWSFGLTENEGGQTEVYVGVMPG